MGLKKMKNLTKAFTLVELLVVIVVIGILVSGITILLNSSRVASRDTRRLSDVKALQDALELYKNTERFYPTVITAGSPLVGPISGLTFLKSVPSDPAANDGSCGSSGYQYSATTTGYTITYCLGKGTAQIAAGSHYAKATGIDVAQCNPESNQIFCSRLGKSCNSYTNNDNCGTARTVNCGTCTGYDTCTSNVCGCTPTTCGAHSWNCGTPDNGCGTPLSSCGTCNSPQTCGGSGTSYVCGCTPTNTCQSLGYTCGTPDNGCGTPLSCGTCNSPDTCGGGGVAGTCGHLTVAYDNGSNGTSGTGTSITWSHTCTGSNRILIVGVLNLGDPDQVTGVTYHGVTMTLVRKDQTFILGGHERMYIYVLMNPDAGAPYNIVVTQSATSASLIGSSVSYTGVKQSGQPETNTFKTQAGATTAMQVSTTTITNNSWLVGYFWIGTNMTASGGTIARNGTNDTLRFYDSNGAKTPAGVYHLDVTYPSVIQSNAQLISITP